MYIVTLISPPLTLFGIKFIVINHKVLYEWKPPAFLPGMWLKKLKLLKNSEAMKVKLKHEIIYYVRLSKFINVKTSSPYTIIIIIFPQISHFIHHKGKVSTQLHLKLSYKNCSRSCQCNIQHPVYHCFGKSLLDSPPPYLDSRADIGRKKSPQK